MNSPEILVISINFVVALLAYLVIYPLLCGANIWRIALNDLLASGTVLLIAGSLYSGSGHEFSLLFFSVNWFWFALLSYAAIETPFMLWYFKKYRVWDTFKYNKSSPGSRDSS
ncbi:hypothetical protein PHACT_02605 [Pseudohongiella acticola]|jgi:hypothetical protein|uniref:Uncharacterized protein n=1 Tax=Pseudohongiella acticola TaxID=1524254 RepID=A0A1E8CIF2_9GAMM|nr:hypothetical protein [Pseudohongiella acticola]OFE12159.1 hypothetical protein PHACT_02605 [Pseudohongiella acticola]